MFWDALNTTLKELIPSTEELPIQVFFDDDKSLCAYQLLRDILVDGDSDEEMVQRSIARFRW